jgi:acylaminoacyl-peptidase
MNCSANLIEKEKSQNYQVYNKLMMFHWDKWLVEGKGSHVFIQRLDLSEQTIVLKDDPKDVTVGMEINCPPLFTDSSNYELSNDGNMIAFSGHLRTREEAWKTGFKTYYQNLLTMKKPVCITNHTSARTQNPVFSKDGTKIAYLAMKIPDLESEILHLEVYNILTNKLTIIPNDEELSIQAFSWKSDSEILFYATTYQVNRLFTVNIRNPIKPIVEKYPVNNPDISYSLPYFPLNNKYIALARIVAFDMPEKLVLFKYNKDTKEKENEYEIEDLNKDFFQKKGITKAEMFNFTGGYNDTVYGFFFKPINFDPDKTYPVVVLIHGGPEGSYTQTFGTSWNPQMYTSRGYAVIMINPHGSVGFGDKFQDDVRFNWGGVPYEDIMMGVSYILDKYSYLDRTRMCAAGASYGGYMINWIEGHNDYNEKLNKDWTFNCLANHDGVFSHISMFYATEEIWFPKEEFCDKQHKGCNPWEGEEIRQKGFELYSNERYVKNWHTPMIIIHGGIDYRVQLTEGLSTFTALQMKQIPSKFLFLHQENHWVLKAENQVIWFEEVYKFFDEYTQSNEYEIPKEAEIYKIFNKDYDY